MSILVGYSRPLMTATRGRVYEEVTHKMMVAAQAAPLRLYIIEPQLLIGKALRSLLERQTNAQVLGDSRAFQIEAIQRTRPDLLLFGIDNSTERLAECIKAARSACTSIRICVLSSYANADLLRRCMAEGADGFLLKDTSTEQLETALRVISEGDSYVDPEVAGLMFGQNTRPQTKENVSLLRREADILRLIATGMTNREIGSELDLSEKTIKNYVSNLFVKINVCTRAQAAVYAIKAGIA